jgi:secreted PhoX family phosphatase
MNTAVSSNSTGDDIDTNPSDNPTFLSVLDARLSRRQVLKGGFSTTALAMFGGVGTLAGCGSGDNTNTPPPAPTAAAAPTLGFTPVAKSLADAVTVPPGYSVSVLYRLGDPIAASVSDFRNDGSDAAASYAQRGGDHHDAIQFYGMGNNNQFSANTSDRGLLVMNHEAITPAFLHPTGATIVNGVRTVAEEVQREFFLHGVSVIEVNRSGSAVTYNRASALNRRVHTLTEMELAGPAARSSLMITKFSPDGSKTRGTVNNCAHGYTPWGTYLACEENWAGYFRRIAATDNPNRSAKELASFARYGVTGNGRELWATVTPDTADNQYGRWNAMKLGTSANGSDDYRNAPNTYGWNVEIDPFNPTSIPKKRTAMGRFAHEGAWVGPVTVGKPLVFYMGCDSRGEYIYKYVSAANWDAADATRGLAAGDKYLNDGKLYVARFNADGNGQWVELRFGINGATAANAAYAFADQADVLINTRLAADAAGATKMDRPEWGAVNPLNGEVYMTLTNNSQRTVATADAANPRFYNDMRTNSVNQRGNPNGHIIRWKEAQGDVTATTFQWDVYLFGARAGMDTANVNLQGLSAGNDFSSPDGLWFSNATKICWIQTDDGAYTDVTNCMMLASIPGVVGDGGKKSITITDGVATRTLDTYVGKPLGEINLRRFLVGPKECEITGITETPDGKTLFVNIQHPGEDTSPNFTTKAFGSYWPDGGTSRPRSATIVITRNDGGMIGLA